MSPRRILEEDSDKMIRMNPFKTFSLTWWQAGIFKVGVLALGIVLGVYWQENFGGYYVWWKQ
jgi:hypothetical protein